MIKNFLVSDAENDVLKGIKGDNYYVFEGDYGKDTVKTKGDKNTLEFDYYADYSFNAKGNDLIINTDANVYCDEYGDLTKEETRYVENGNLSEFYIHDGKIYAYSYDEEQIGDRLVYEKDGIFTFEPPVDLAKQEIESEFFYNGDFTDEEFRTVENKSVKDLYLVDGQLSETGSADQLVGGNKFYQVGIQDTLYYSTYSPRLIDTYMYDATYIAKDSNDPLYADSSSGEVYATYQGDYSIPIEPGTLIFRDSFSKCLTTDPNYSSSLTLFGGAPGGYMMGDVYYNPTTGAITSEQVEGSVLLEGDLFYDSYNKKITTERVSIVPSEDNVYLLSELYLVDGYLTTGQGRSTLIGEQDVYLNPLFYNADEGVFIGDSYQMDVFSFESKEGWTKIESDTYIKIISGDLHPNSWGNIEICFNHEPEMMEQENHLFVDETSDLYWYNGQFYSSETHEERNKSISELYLVDGQLKEEGDPSQLIGDKTLYVKDGLYYTTPYDDSYILVEEEYTGEIYNEIYNSGDGTVVIKNFLKGNLDVKINIQGERGLTLADLVNEAHIMYDYNDAVKKQTIKAHKNWNSEIIASDFNDKIYGGKFNDNIYGADGADTIYTRTGEDMVDAGAGDDKIYLNGAGPKFVDAGDDDDKIYLTAKNISADITGGTGDDKIYIKKAVLENTVLNFETDSGDDIVAVSKKVDVSNLTLNIENFDESTSTFTKSGNSLVITSGNDSVTLTNYFKKGYKVSEAILADKTLAEWVSGADLLIDSNSKTTKGTNYDDVITTGSKVKTVNAYAGDDVIVSLYQKMTVNGGEGYDTFDFNTDNVDNYTVLFNVTKEGNVDNALYVVADDAKKLSNGITLKDVEKVSVNGTDYTLTSEVIESVQSWLSSANNGEGYDSVADAISDKCNLQELIAAFNPEQQSV